MSSYLRANECMLIFINNQVALITFWKLLSQLKWSQASELHLCLALEVSDSYVQFRDIMCAWKRSKLVWLSLYSAKTPSQYHRKPRPSGCLHNTDKTY